MCRSKHITAGLLLLPQTGKRGLGYPLSLHSGDSGRGCGGGVAGALLLGSWGLLGAQIIRVNPTTAVIPATAIIF